MSTFEVMFVTFFFSYFCLDTLNDYMKEECMYLFYIFKFKVFIYKYALLFFQPNPSRDHVITITSQPLVSQTAWINFYSVIFITLHHIIPHCTFLLSLLFQYQ